MSNQFLPVPDVIARKWSIRFALVAGLIAMSAGSFAYLPAQAQRTPAGGTAGLGVVIRKQGGAILMRTPSDSGGRVALSGMRPGTYSVRLATNAEEISVVVGPDGILQVGIRDGRTVQSLAGQASELAPLDVNALFGSEPLIVPRSVLGRAPALPLRPAARYVDVNRSSAADILRMAPSVPMSTAELIVRERQNFGPFATEYGFALRICTKASVDFGAAAILIGETQIAPRAGVSGFRCSQQSTTGMAVFRIFADSFAYAVEL